MAPDGSRLARAIEYVSLVIGEIELLNELASALAIDDRRLGNDRTTPETGGQRVWLSTASRALHQGNENTMTAPTPEANPAETKQVSFLEFNIFILRHLRLIAGCAVALFLVVIVALLFRDRQYTSSTLFAAQAADRVPGLAGLAAQFGVTAAGPDVTDSPAFYADLLKTREVLTSVLQGEYRFPTAKGLESVKLIDVLKVRANSEGERIEKAITELTSLLQVALKTRTGVVTVQ